jgi:hypothetical protein
VQVSERRWWPLLLAIARLVAAAFILLQGEERASGWVCRHPEFCWATHMERLTEAEFKLRYCVGSESFYELLEKLRPELEVHPLMSLRSRAGKPIPIEAVPCATLQEEIRSTSCSSTACRRPKSCASCAWCVVDAINLRLDNMKFPIDDLDAMCHEGA